MSRDRDAGCYPNEVDFIIRHNHGEFTRNPDAPMMKKKPHYKTVKRCGMKDEDSS